MVKKSMSILDPKLNNPTQKFIKWSGSKGKFYFHDKTQSKEIIFENPFYLVIVDQLATITGFNDKSQSQIYSNEVHNIMNEPLRVKSFKGGDIVTGLYKEIVPQLNGTGAKYAKSVYGVVKKQSGTLELVNVQFSGSALTELIETKIKDGECILLSPSTEVCKKGKTEYYKPKIVKVNLDIQLYEDAKTLYKDVLLPYLNQYKAGKVEIKNLENDLPEIDVNY
jgi:hypothetical protein